MQVKVTTIISGQTMRDTAPLTNVYALTLRAADGRERRTLAYLPTEAVRRQYYEKARRNGLEILMNDE